MAGALQRAGQAGWGQCRRQSGCPTALGSPRPTSGAERGLSRRILGSCTGLMQAIRVLVLASKDLQREIVESGRVSQGRGVGQQGLGQLGVTTRCWGHLRKASALWCISTSCQELLPQPWGLTLAAVPAVSERSLSPLPMRGTL